MFLACCVKTKPTCPFGHVLRFSGYDIHSRCDICGIYSHGQMQCSSCDRYSACGRCYKNIESMQSVVDGYYDDECFPRCAQGHMLWPMTNDNRHQRCTRCRRGISRRRKVYECTQCSAAHSSSGSNGVCDECYLLIAFDKRLSLREDRGARKCQDIENASGCTYCRLESHLTEREIRTHSIFTSECVSCGAEDTSGGDRTLFTCTRHPFSKICARCNIKEIKGIRLPPERGVAVISSVMEAYRARRLLLGLDVAEAPAEERSPKLFKPQGTCVIDLRTSLEPQEKKDPEEKLQGCQICFEKKVNCVFGCGHPFCSGCVDLMLKTCKSIGREPHCPVCKGKIFFIANLFL